jgi:hypothetical protein
VSRPFRICPQCGGSTWIELDDTHQRCADCGHGSTVAVLTVGAEPGAPVAPSRPPPADAEWRRAVAAATFTPYGLDERWTGPRWVGGHGSSNGRVTHLALVHGDPGLTGSHLRVDTRIPQMGTVDVEVVFVARQLVMGLAREVGHLREDVRRAMFSRGEPDPLAPWTSLAVDVEGTSHPFHLLSDGDHWVALGKLPSIVVALRAHTWDPGGIGLVPVRDLSPYED